MILFMVVTTEYSSDAERYSIPLHLNAHKRIAEWNVRFVSWNEVDYQLDAENILRINNISDLKNAVFHAAMQDMAVCGKMIEQFRLQYGIDLCGLCDDTGNPAYHIIMDVFSQWAHPMIGNVVVSSGIRPQTEGDQYTRNWNGFPEEYMTANTKSMIERMIRESMNCDPLSPEVSPAGLQRLSKASRDQVRCCRDMCELARAVIGEITTYATRKLEKIYALELCASQPFQEAQRRLIEEMLTVHKENGDNLKLENLFLSAGDNPIQRTDYIKFYFPTLYNRREMKKNPKGQWVAFAKLINTCVSQAYWIPYDERTFSQAIKKIFAECVELFLKFPPVIRRAIILNDVRKLGMFIMGDVRRSKIQRYSLTVPERGSNWEIIEAASPGFIPVLSKPTGRMNEKILLWNWTRDEMYPATETYRKCLMPLWAGPSGHSAGLVDFYGNYLGKDFIIFEENSLPISLVILPTMFTFWRLYYDKRICAVHTLAETFEGALSHVLQVNGRRYDAGNILGQLNAEAALVNVPQMPAYREVFSTIRMLPGLEEEMINITGVMHPVRIMRQIKAAHYDTLPGEDGIGKMDALDGVIDRMRDELTRSGYEIPRWSKKITGMEERTGALSTAQRKINDCFTGLVIRSFPNLNVKVFGQNERMLSCLSVGVRCAWAEAVSASSDRLRFLYDKIHGCETSGKNYQFTYDFGVLPKCYIDRQRAPFLAGLCFSGIRECGLGKDVFTYTAVVGTDADFWKSVKGMVSLADQEEMFCTVTQTSDGLRFAGEIGVHAVYRVTDKLALVTRRIVLESGLDDQTCFPSICVMAEIAADKENAESRLEIMERSVTGSGRFDLKMVIFPGTSRLFISGAYEEGKVLTLRGLLSLFGLDEVVCAGDLLPDQESVFGSLGLRDVTIMVDTESVGITQISFTITAERPWNIFEHKITLQPYFEMKIAYPFDGKRRKISYSILGKWHVGSTVFDLLYRSDQTIYAGLADHSILNFADVAQLFAKDVSFPAVKLSGMEFAADVVSGNYSLYLSAEQVLEFGVGKVKFGIESLSFALGFMGGKFGELKLSGAFTLGGITFTLSGSYRGEGGLLFEAMAYAEETYSLEDFMVQAAQDFGQSFDRNSLPDTLLTVNIHMLTVSYQSKEKTFHGYVDLENVLMVSEDFSIREVSLEISSEKGEAVEFKVAACICLCGTIVNLSLSKDKDGFLLAGEAVFENLTFGNIAGELGIGLDHVPDFIAVFTITRLEVSYHFTTKKFGLQVTTSAGMISAEISAGGQTGWAVAYEADPKVSVDMFRMPLLGELVKKTAPETSDLSVKDFALEASSDKGVVFRCRAFGSVCTVELFKPVQQNSVKESSETVQSDLSCKSLQVDWQKKAVVGYENALSVKDTDGFTVKWIKLNKTIAVLTIAKAGIGLDGSRVVVLLDASLALSPFTFSLSEAGVGINISKLSDAAFYLSGFGVSFENGALAVSGSFSRKVRDQKEVYAGSLLVKCKAVTVMAVGEYCAGSLFAYMALSASIGGPPAFFVTGLALGFGYNKKLSLPPVEMVPDYPLIKAVKKGFDAQTLDELNKYITEESGQNFLTAGVRFTSFKIMDGFLLLSVSFGKKFQIGVLGIADISMPPNAPSNPVAKAQLAIKAEYDQSAGVFCAEARLTSESYILSRDCKLTGGFAAYFWFGDNEHSGDFVITLGGYHPAFRKPAHYPEVPRLGLNWNLSTHLNISGEIYFALTPSAVMAGGKLSAVYTQGKLRAWFIAYADFIVSWKPFYYRAEIGVSLGASYRVDVWFIHKTFSIELAAELALWGPEVQGRLHVSWFIISFTISFSKGTDHSGETIGWDAFKESFLKDSAQNSGMRISGGNNTTDEPERLRAQQESYNKSMTAGDTDILAVTVTGVVGQAPDGTDLIDPNGFAITLVSKIPEQGNVRPIGNAALKSQITLTVEDERHRKADEKFRQAVVRRNMPAALWKRAPDQKDRLKEESLLKDARCGVTYELQDAVREQALFPKTRFISLEELYRQNTLGYEDCFQFVSGQRVDLSDADSIRWFSLNADSEDTRKRRKNYLEDNGITEQVTVSRFVEEAEDWLAEELLIGW